MQSKVLWHSFGRTVLLMFILGAVLSFSVMPSQVWAQPETPETMCDGVDNDGNEGIDEGFNVGTKCTHVETNSFGSCGTEGTLQCNEEGTDTVCVLAQGVTPTEATAETLAANNLSCFDNVDNDCDGNTDHADAANGYPGQVCNVSEEQFCNGFDDDNDGNVDEDFNIADSCTVGVGECERTGSLICSPNQATSVCSVSAGSPGSENTPGKLACTDGLDNDCDGDTDLADDSCQTAEMCDGVDNDGDGQTDEGFNVGASCSSGLGECAAQGTQVCNAVGDGTECNAIPLAQSFEGPTGATCSDDKDNDCDGATDINDPNCASTDLSISCRLLPVNGAGKLMNPKPPIPGTSCNERFRVDIQSSAPSQFVSAELMGLNPDGTLINLSPASQPIKNGDLLHLASRIDPSDFKVDRQGRFIDAFAPVPVVKAVADTGQNTVEAFCSIVPWLNVDKPSGAEQVVSATAGDAVEVVVAIPGVDPATLEVLVDGVDILAGEVNPATDFPNAGAPIPNFTVNINGQQVTVSNLVVDAAPITEYSSNSLSMLLEGLSGGGHIVVVNGDPHPDALPPITSAECHRDNILDAGTVSVFGIQITNPLQDEVEPAGDTQVQATVSHGRAIESAHVHGAEVPVGGQSCDTLEFDAFGETFSVDSCTLNISKSIPQTNLSQPLELGTFDIGQNKFTVSARDDLFNLAFADRRFISGNGTTTSPAVQALSQTATKAIENGIKKVYENAPEDSKPIDVQVRANGFDITIAFVFGITEQAVNTFFQSSCDEALTEVKAKTEEALLAAQFDPVDVPGGASCDVNNARITGLDVTFDGNLVCNVDPKQDLMTVTVTLPNILFEINVEGRCRDTFLGVCISETIVNVNLDVALNNFGVDFDITEQLALAGGQAPSDIIQGQINIAAPGSGIEFNCITGFFNDVAEFFTFGLVDFEGSASEAIQNALTLNVDISEALRAKSPDPLEVKPIEVNEQPVQADGLEMEQELLNIEITPAGFTGTIGSTFTVPLPESEEGGVSTLTPAPAPELPIPGVEDLFFAASDDIFNLLFSAIALQGALTIQCEETGLTVNDILPADCNGLGDDTAIGRCLGTKGVNCNGLPFFQFLTCEDTKSQLASKNISKDTGLLFCAQQPIAPRTLIKDNLATADKVEALLHSERTQVTIMLDRNPTGMTEDLASFIFAPKCFDFFQDPNADCKLSDACFNLNLATDFELGTSGGNAQITRTVKNVADSVGYLCGGQFDLGDGGQNLLTEAGITGPVEVIGDNIQNIVGAFEPLGLELGGLVDFKNPKLISIDVGTVPNDDCSDCAEYLGFTGQIDPAP